MPKSHKPQVRSLQVKSSLEPSHVATERLVHAYERRVLILRRTVPTPRVDGLEPRATFWDVIPLAGVLVVALEVEHERVEGASGVGRGVQEVGLHDHAYAVAVDARKAGVGEAGSHRMQRSPAG